MFDAVNLTAYLSNRMACFDVVFSPVASHDTLLKKMNTFVIYDKSNQWLIRPNIYCKKIPEKDNFTEYSLFACSFWCDSDLYFDLYILA